MTLPPKEKKKKLKKKKVKLKSAEPQVIRDPNAFDPGALIDRALEHDLDPSVIDQLDDKWIEKPHNVFHFLVSRKFLAIDPFPMQVKILAGMCEDVCLTPTCTDLDFWNSVKADTSLAELRDRVTFFHFGKCRKCGKTRGDFVNEGKYFYKEELVGCAGQRASKSVMVAGMLAPYHLVRFLSLKSPAQSLGLLAGSQMQMTFSALTSDQSQRNLWTNFSARIDLAPWFRQYHKFLDEEGKRLGVELYKNMSTFVEYRHKHLHCHYTGADFRTLRGATRFFAAIDELGFFDHFNNGKVMQNAHETYLSLSNSLRTIRSAAYKRQKRGEYDIPTGIMANISSPSAIDDEIMKLIDQANDPERGRKVYAFHYATHEINPEMTIESLKEEAKAKGLSFERDFLAIPPLSSAPYIPDKGLLDKVFCGTKPNLFQIEVKTKSAVHMGVNEIYFWGKAVSPQSEKSIPRCVAVDAGETNNSFACAIGYYDNVGDKVVVEQLVELRPGPGRERVFFPGMLDDFFKVLADNFWIRYFVFDTWGPSSTFQQGLNTYKKGTEADTYTLGWNDFRQIKSNILGENVVFPLVRQKYSEYGPAETIEIFKNAGPAAYLKLQLHIAREVGRKVTKPTGDTDDLMRATCLLLHYIYKYKDEFSNYTVGMPGRVQRQGAGHTYVAIRKAGMGGRGGSSGHNGSSSVVSFRKSGSSGSSGFRRR